MALGNKQRAGGAVGLHRVHVVRAAGVRAEGQLGARLPAGEGVVGAGVVGVVVGLGDLLGRKVDDEDARDAAAHAGVEDRLGAVGRDDQPVDDGLGLGAQRVGDVGGRAGADVELLDLREAQARAARRHQHRRAVGVPAGEGVAERAAAVHLGEARAGRVHHAHRRRARGVEGERHLGAVGREDRRAHVDDVGVGGEERARRAARGGHQRELLVLFIHRFGLFINRWFW